MSRKRIITSYPVRQFRINEKDYGLLIKAKKKLKVTWNELFEIINSKMKFK
jgi:hypothetical protein